MPFGQTSRNVVFLKFSETFSARTLAREIFAKGHEPEPGLVTLSRNLRRQFPAVRIVEIHDGDFRRRGVARSKSRAFTAKYASSVS